MIKSVLSQFNDVSQTVVYRVLLESISGYSTWLFIKEGALNAIRAKFSEFEKGVRAGDIPEFRFFDLSDRFSSFSVNDGQSEEVVINAYDNIGLVGFKSDNDLLNFLVGGDDRLTSDFALSQIATGHKISDVLHVEDFVRDADFTRIVGEEVKLNFEFEGETPVLVN
jgi:hypothetical protein